MPIHLDDLDVSSQVAGLRSALIVPCNMCPAVTVAVKEGEPLIRFFRNFLKSAPFERHIRKLQSRLEEEGLETAVFRSDIPHQWFACMWTWARRKKLRERAKQFDAVIVLGCDTAVKSVRDAVLETGCKVIEGMEVTSFMNAKLRFQWPCNISFEDCQLVPISRKRRDDEVVAPRP
jgi:hypothetical protein